VESPTVATGIVTGRRTEKRKQV